MKVSLKFVRCTLLISAALLVVAAIVIGAGVIPPVKADIYPHATPEQAVPAFWVNVVINLLVAAALGGIALRTTGRRRSSTIVLSLMAFLVLLLAFALIDAATDSRSHGPAMCTATILLFLCAAADLLAAVLVVITAFLFPKQT
jgi:hypothetical protein